MTLSLVVSGILLWKRRRETGDYSRIIWAVLSWFSAFFTLTFIMRTWMGTTTADGAFFEPEHTFVPILMQMTFFLYPLEVIRPTIGRAKVYALLFVPLLLLVFTGMCAGIEYTPIYSYTDLWQHIGEFNVWFRLLTLFVMLFYCFSLFLVPYDWRKSSADKKFIMSYSCVFCLIGLLHFVIQMSHYHWFVLAHQLVWITFFLSVAWYELKVRLLVSETMTQSQNTCEDNQVDDGLWMKILQWLDDNEKWRDPNLSLSTLSDLLDSNRTYVGEAFKRNTGMTFVEYLTKRRIDFVKDKLNEDRNVDIHELFNYVGYRQRSTAWRNFQKITGVTPTEYLDSLT
jgi:AraC-like DNA-binding protein